MSTILTRRDKFAKAALQGILASNAQGSAVPGNYTQVKQLAVKASVEIADALIAELDRAPPPQGAMEGSTACPEFGCGLALGIRDGRPYCHSCDAWVVTGSGR